MELIQNVEIDSGSENPIRADIYISNLPGPKPVVIFNHGFKGFKDWGYWHLLGKKFAEQGFIFIKFNQSHNGMSVKDIDQFSRLDLFAVNTYSREKQDLQAVIDWLFNNSFIPYSYINQQRIALLGHSRGGTMALHYGSQNPKITHIVSWAAYHNYENRFMQPQYDMWDDKQTVYIPNGRTGVDMPQHISIYHDYRNHKDELSIKNSVSNSRKPTLIVHGTEDAVVQFQEAIDIKSYNPEIELYLVPNADHVFGGKHPWTETQLPEYAQFAFDKTLAFLKK